MIVINTQNVQFNFLFSDLCEFLGWCFRNREERALGDCDQYQFSVSSGLRFGELSCSGGVSETERRELLVIVINTRMFNFQWLGWGFRN